VKRRGAGRRRLLVALCPRDRLVVDVGADHGHVAHALGGIATERLPHRIGRRDVRWVVADGLSPFREVPVAVIAGLGARSIQRILARGPRPGVLVAHAPDDPGALRVWLAEDGWRIDAEGLAREGNRFAEVLRAVPGRETAAGLALELGPRLLEGDDPLLRAWMEHTRSYWDGLAVRTAVAAPVVSGRAAERAAFLEECLRQRGWHGACG
jgi:tRNA A22 N-methylase